MRLALPCALHRHVQVGCVAALALVFCAAGPAHAATMVAADTSWILTSTALVLFMSIPGLSCFYGGLVKRSSVLSVLMQCFAITCMMSIIWFVAGYSMRYVWP